MKKWAIILLALSLLMSCISCAAADSIPVETPIPGNEIFCIDEVACSILRVNDTLTDTYSNPYLNRDGYLGYVSQISAGNVDGQPSVHITMTFRNEKGNKAFFADYNDAMINGTPYTVISELDQFLIMSGTGSNFVGSIDLVPDGTPIIDPEDIKTIEFSFRGIRSGLNEILFSINHVTLTVDPAMEKGEARSVLYLGKGIAWKTDGSVAFQYGDDYDTINSFSKGLAVARKQIDADTQLCGAIDKTGTVVIPMIYEKAGTAFSEGLLNVRKDGKWGYIDETGAVVIEPQYDYVREFASGVAPVFTGTVKSNGSPDTGVYRFVDRENNIIEALGEWESVYSFEEDHARVMKDGLWGLIDRDGNLVLEPEFSNIGSFFNGFAYVNKDGLYSCVDQNGQLISDPVFDESMRFSENGFTVVKENGKYRLVDTGLNTVRDLSEYTYVKWDYSAGFALCYAGTSLWERDGRPNLNSMPEDIFVINEQGNTILTLFVDNFDSITFAPGIGIAYLNPYDEELGDASRKAGVVDFEGNTLIPFAYSKIRYAGQDDIFIALYEQIDMETYTFTSDYYFCTVSGGQGPKLEFDPDAYDSYTIDSIKFSDSIMIMNPMRK